jgi:hypothetical protein
MIKKLTIFSTCFVTLMSQYAASTAINDENIEYIINGTRHNSTLADFCNNYCISDQSTDAEASWLDYTGAVSNVTFIAFNCTALAGTAFTLYKYRHFMFHKKPALLSSESMEIKEILPLTMPENYRTILTEIDEVLSTEALEASKDSKWKKFPIYGQFREEESSYVDRLTINWFKGKPRELLYGYVYENGPYTIEIKYHFNIKSPHRINKKNFYQINPIFKNITRSVKEDPKFTPSTQKENVEGDVEMGVIPAHPNINSSTFLYDPQQAIEFLEQFLKSGRFFKSHFPSRLLTHNPFKSIITELQEEESQLEAFYVKEEEESALEHLYILFPTYVEDQKDKEEYKIILHMVKEHYYEGSIPKRSHLFLGRPSTRLQFTKLSMSDDEGAFNALDIKRRPALKLLKQNIDNIEIRKILAPEIFRNLIKGNLPEEMSSNFSNVYAHYKSILKQQNKAVSKIYGELSISKKNRKGIEDLLNNRELSEEQRETLEKLKNDFSTTRNAMLKGAERREICLAYLKAFKSGERPISHSASHEVQDGIPATGLYDAIAFLKNINLYIWQSPDNSTSLQLIHWFEPLKAAYDKHILYADNNRYHPLEEISNN